MRVGIILIATNKYTRFVKPVINSIKQNFLLNHEKTYYIFTDSDENFGDNCVNIKITHETWPYVTLHRYKHINSASAILKTEDFLYYLDVDMLVVDKVGDEIFGDIVATNHPGFVNKRGTHEMNYKSTAFIHPHTNYIYVCGGFQGGAAASFLEAAKTISVNIEIDKAIGIIAVWHDESHWNKFCVDNMRRVKLLPHDYAYSPKLTRKKTSPQVSHPKIICLEK